MFSLCLPKGTSQLSSIELKPLTRWPLKRHEDAEATRTISPAYLRILIEYSIRPIYIDSRDRSTDHLFTIRLLQIYSSVCNCNAR